MLLRALLAVTAVTTLVSAQEVPEESTRVEVGKKAPDFVMTNIDGKEIHLSDKLGKDKNIVLMFSRAHW